MTSLFTILKSLTIESRNQKKFVYVEKTSIENRVSLVHIEYMPYSQPLVDRLHTFFISYGDAITEKKMF